MTKGYAPRSGEKRAVIHVPRMLACMRYVLYGGGGGLESHAEIPFYRKWLVEDTTHFMEKLHELECQYMIQQRKKPVAKNNMKKKDQGGDIDGMIERLQREYERTEGPEGESGIQSKDIEGGYECTGAEEIDREMQE